MDGRRGTGKKHHGRRKVLGDRVRIRRPLRNKQQIIITLPAEIPRGDIGIRAPKGCKVAVVPLDRAPPASVE